MTRGRLILQSLFYHWRGNLAVLLGVAVGTAVLTGALLVGDSLRGSLEALAEKQLGWVDHVLIGKRLIRQELAGELVAGHACPALVLQGAAGLPAESDELTQRVAGVAILGVDESFWFNERPPVEPAFWQARGSAETRDGAVVLSAALARELKIGPGAKVVLEFQKLSAVPRESRLGQRDAAKILTRLPVRVEAVLKEDDPGGGFSLNPSPAAPRTAFVPLSLLQAKLDDDARSDKSNLRVQGRVNALFAQGATAALQKSLAEHLELSDWGLVLRDPDSRTADLFGHLSRKPPAEGEPDRLARGEWERRVPAAFVKAVDRDQDGVLTRAEVSAFFHRERGYLSLESQQLLLEPPVVPAALAAAAQVQLKAAPTLVYLADSIAHGEERSSYVLVAAVDAGLSPPLPPLLPSGVQGLADNEIVLVQPKQPILRVQPGDDVTLAYYGADDEDQLRKEVFKLKALLPLEGVATDAGLTPDFPGITDQASISDWDPPAQLHLDNGRVNKADENYWKEYRTAPKAYVTLRTGQRLWSSRFGQLTSLRMVPAAGNDLAQAGRAFRESFRREMKPEQGGLVFDPVRQRRLEAGRQGTPFGMLFLCFSGFLIMAALLLVGLLCRLNIDRRAPELGILLATGYRRATIRWLLLAEGCLLAAAGGAVGLAAAGAYAWLLLRLLAAWWPGGLEHSLLHLHVAAWSLVAGYSAGLCMSLLTIAWAVRVLGRVPVRALLVGECNSPDEARPGRKPRWSVWLAGVTGVLGLLLLVAGGFVHGSEEQASTFFGGGALLLTAALAAMWAWMRGARHDMVSGRGLSALTRLAVRNAARYPARSLLTAGLLASAAFVIVAVQSFRREAARDMLERHSGSGGFVLLGESGLPLFNRLESSSGRQQIYDQQQLRLQGRKWTSGRIDQERDRTKALLDSAVIFSLRLRAGDDASCLNLAQPRQPRLLGLPHPLLVEDRFRFASSEGTDPAARANPWLLLERPAEGNGIPVIVDATTAEWMLHKQLGDEYNVRDDRGQEHKLRIVGLLENSIFQSELLLSEADFLKLYPTAEGYQAFLVAAPPDRANDVKNLLGDQGLALTYTADRLKAYLDVENTYLLTFQALGGMGLLLGTLGLAVVLLRSAWERRGELALLRALGFRQRALGWLVLAENAFLLVVGLSAGTAAALLAVAPHLLAGLGDVPWLSLAGLLVLVLLVGLGAGAAAVLAALRAPLLPALRRE